MRDDIHTDAHKNLYEAQEYHPGGYPQLRKNHICQTITHKNAAKDSKNTLWGMTLFGFACASAVCVTVVWLA